MSTPTILVIDDSTTIRKMVDSHLSQEGYRVVLAPTGELGLEMAVEIKPDLILLDHQLPGTTGIEVCRKIIAQPGCDQIPFVVSSTLRKQAYVEYMDVPNVVDSLPKPFKPDLLRMTVANALETGSLIVSSQANGTAVPEVVDETDQPAFSGDFRWLGLREVIDFLNNGRKSGMLEVETERNRVCFYLHEGRIQGVLSPSFDADEIASQLPESMKELSPLLQFTLSTGSSTRIDGLVELMDKKVLDPRMLKALLRHQAAVLTRYCFLHNPQNFSFLPERTAPSLLTKAAIDTCLPAILIDGALLESPGSPPENSSVGWVRNSLRGQNLDRTGLSAKHVQLLSQLDSRPKNTGELAAKAGVAVQEAEQVLEGLLLAEWVETKTLVPTQSILAFDPDVHSSTTLKSVIEDSESGWTGHVVRDEFSLTLLLKRKSPDIVLLAVDGEQELDLPDKLKDASLYSNTKRLFLIAPEDQSIPIAATLQSIPIVRRPFTADDLKNLLAPKRGGSSQPEAVTESASQPECLEPAGVQ